MELITGDAKEIKEGVIFNNCDNSWERVITKVIDQKKNVALCAFNSVSDANRETANYKGFIIFERRRGVIDYVNGLMTTKPFKGISWIPSLWNQNLDLLKLEYESVQKYTRNVIL